MVMSSFPADESMKIVWVRWSPCDWGCPCGGRHLFQNTATFMSPCERGRVFLLGSIQVFGCSEQLGHSSTVGICLRLLLGRQVGSHGKASLPELLHQCFCRGSLLQALGRPG